MNNNFTDEKIKLLKKTLDIKIKESSTVTIVPHTKTDFDALSSAIAIYILAQRHKKNVNILINDSYKTLDKGVQAILNEILTRGINIINYDTYKNKYLNNANLLILVDTSKQELIPIEKEVIEQKEKDEKLIIDHLLYDNSTIDAKDKFVFSKYFSTCEIITKMFITSRVKFTKDLATYLYAGMWLDSNKLTKKKAGTETHKWASKLVENNADVDKVNDLFAKEYTKKMQDLIDNQFNLLNYTVAYLTGNNDEFYTEDELKKVAEICLKYQIDGAFAIGNVEDNIVSINARSNGNINVGEIMKYFNGDGNILEAKATVKNETPQEVEKKLIKVIRPNFYIDKEN